MTEIRTITSITQEDLEKIVPGYTSQKVIQVQRMQSTGETLFSLNEVPVEPPFVKVHDYSDPSTVRHYNELISTQNSLGIFLEQELVGLIICELQEWNATFVVREFGVSPHCRGKGFGARLMEKAESLARARGARRIFCETQTTNEAAIRFYKKHGFEISGIDVSLYSNQDLEKGEVAVFLSKAL